MGPPLLKQDLDAVECPNPECSGEHPIALAPFCHPRAAIYALYDSRRGVLTLTCHDCKTPFCEIEVASTTVH